MTVTFTATSGAVVGFVISCGCEDANAAAPRYGTYEDAIAALSTVEDGLRSPLPGCDMPDICPEYPLHVWTIEETERPDITLANANAALVLDTLGLPSTPDRMSGELAPATLLGRVLLALALAPFDAGVPAHEMNNAEKRTLLGLSEGADVTGLSAITCGRAPGYLQDVLGRLHDLAGWCARQQRNVVWY